MHFLYDITRINLVLGALIDDDLSAVRLLALTSHGGAEENTSGATAMIDLTILRNSLRDFSECCLERNPINRCMEISADFSRYSLQILLPSICTKVYEVACR